MTIVWIAECGLWIVDREIRNPKSEIPNGKAEGRREI